MYLNGLDKCVPPQILAIPHPHISARNSLASMGFATPAPESSDKEKDKGKDEKTEVCHLCHSTDAWYI
jgi:hypothetical protein